VGALEEVHALARAVTKRRNLRLWDVEMVGSSGRPVVRIYVDDEDGIDLDTVAQVSEELSRGLDLHDPIAGRYTLEVSSPGLERTLRSPEHFTVSVGRPVVVKTTAPVVGESNRIEGVITSADEEAVGLKGDAGEVSVPYEVIKSARTVFEWKK
jgi:ribosome maturation factor RimP